MAKKKEAAWKVVREYKNLYSLTELIRRIIRHHLGNSDMALPEFPESSEKELVNHDNIGG